MQQLDAQGPAVVERVSTQVGDLACSRATLSDLVEALHSGKSVTIATSDGKSATFDASGAHLGYGEAYIALALAAQQLRNAGVTGCATAEQWHAVLLGGPLNTAVTSSSTNSYAAASGSTQLPGIVTLHTQGQGWGQIAHSSHLELGKVVSSSAVSMNHSASAMNRNASDASSPSPTGLSSAEMNQGHADADKAKGDDDKAKTKKHWWNFGRDKNEEKAKEDKSTSSAPSDASASTAAGESASSAADKSSR